MSEQKWTKEPWEASDNGSDTHPAFHDDRFGHAIAMSPYDYDRAMACVNALAGISDPSAFVATARADAKRVRELEGALESIIERCDTSTLGVPPHLLDQINNARTVLTRKPAQDTQSICDCGKIEHGRHHSACPVMQRKPAQDCALCRGVGKVNRCEGDTSVPVDCPKCKPAQEGAGG